MATDPEPLLTGKQIRDMVLRHARGALPDVERPLFVLLRSEICTAYARRWPERRGIVEGYLDFAAPASTVACWHGKDERRAREWVQSFVTFAAGYVPRRLQQDHDQAVLESICAMTHGRARSAGPVNAEPLRANTCLGCALRAG